MKRTAKITGSNGELIAQFDIPNSASEVPLSRFVSFLHEDGKKHLAGANAILCMTKAVSEFCGVDHDKILASDFIGDTSDRKFVTGIGRIYAACVEAVSGWAGRQRNSFYFTHNDTEYHIPSIYFDSLAGHILPAMTTNEAIESLETIRIFEEHIKRSASVRDCAAMIISGVDEGGEYMKRLRAILPEASNLKPSDTEKLFDLAEKHGDPDGNFQFTRYIKMIAILARKRGEMLPTNDPEKRVFIADRMREFENIDTQTALDVDFFLLSTCNASGMIKPVIGSLIRQALEVAVEMKVRSGRRTSGQ